MTDHLIVGLGNPGEAYTQTPHNLGFLALDGLAQSLGASFAPEKKFQAEIATADTLTLMKPQTFMNRSSESVRAFVDYYKLPIGNIWVIHDDFAVPFGHLKISQGKGPGGHNGVSSIIDALQTSDIVRFRLGIGKPDITDLERYVLTPFTSTDQTHVTTLLQQAVAAITLAVTSGVPHAMNQFHTAAD